MPGRDASARPRLAISPRRGRGPRGRSSRPDREGGRAAALAALGAESAKPVRCNATLVAGPPTAVAADAERWAGARLRDVQAQGGRAGRRRPGRGRARGRGTTGAAASRRQRRLDAPGRGSPAHRDGATRNRARRAASGGPRGPRCRPQPDRDPDRGRREREQRRRRTPCHRAGCLPAGDGEARQGRRHHAGSRRSPGNCPCTSRARSTAP